MNSNWNNIQQQQQQSHLGLGQLYSSINCTPHQNHHQTPVSDDFLLLGTSSASSSSSIQNGAESRNRKQHKSETPESRALRLKNQRIRTAMRRLNETDEERQKRLRDARIRSIQRRQNESSEERRIRLANQRYRTARKRLLEKNSKESGQEEGQGQQQQKQINPVKIEMEPTTIVCEVPQLRQSSSSLASKPQPSNINNLPLFSPNSSAMPNHQQYLSTICPGNLEHHHLQPGSRPRPMETIEERDRRLFEQRLRTERRRQNETTEERMIRLEKQRLRTASRRRRKDDNSSGFNSNSNSSESNESSAAAAAIVPSELPMSANNSSRFGPSHLQTNFQNGVVSANPFMMNNFLIGGAGGGGSVFQNRGVGGTGYQSIPEIYSMVLNAAASSSTSSAGAASSSLNHHQTTSSSSNPNFESPPKQ